MKKEEKKQNVIDLKYKVVWKIVLTLVRPYLKIFTNYSYSKPIKLPEPSVILANHNTDYDTLLLASCFNNQTYFIASENCFRKGLKSKLLTSNFGLISKIKGASDTLSVMKAIRTLREGKNVCIFPEGGRSFNGITSPIKIATGKFVKVSQASLVTIRLSGGYMKIPRWGFGKRSGKWSGKIINIYSPEQLKNMSAEEITNCINDDLYENAYETQKINPVHYKGKNLALGMECALSVCPSCKSIGQLKTQKDTIFCQKCGLKTQINDLGYFTPDFKFNNPTEWDLWQEDFYKNYITEFTDNTKEIIFDQDVCLRKFNSEHQTFELGRGRFSLYKDRFCFKPANNSEINLMIENIPDASVFSRSNLNFSDKDGFHYELYADRLINVRKYLSCWEYLRNQ